MSVSQGAQGDRAAAAAQTGRQTTPAHQQSMRPHAHVGVTAASQDLTPDSGRTYVDAINHHSEQTAQTSRFPGQNFENLAEYLKRGLRIRTSPGSSARRLSNTAAEFPFLAVYSFDQHGMQTFREYSDPEQCPSSNDNTPTILFLRGKPSAAWLTKLGARFKIDPEFFNRHLDFWARRGRTNYFSTPSLPSCQNMLFDLPYFTLGQTKVPFQQNDPHTMRSMRREVDKQFKSYWREIQDRFGGEDTPGDSLVRHFYLHDQIHFAIEQRVSILLNKLGSAWQLLVWLDTGKPLAQSPRAAPWVGMNRRDSSFIPLRSYMYPTISTQPRVALEAYQNRLNDAPNTPDDLAHSAASLHLEYGKALVPAVMMADPFYALYDVFHFVANTYQQYFNMLETKEKDRTLLTLEYNESALSTANDHPEFWDSTNLRYDQAALTSLLPQLRSIKEVIKNRGPSGPTIHSRYRWPRQEENQTQSSEETTLASEASESLLRDFESLTKQCERLLERYRDSMNLLMNRAVMAESAKSVAQAREVTKLTRLAFVFVPLSFTTSFFGMNLSDLSNWKGNSGQTPPIWLWVVISVPIVLISLLVVIYDMRDVGRGLASFKFFGKNVVSREDPPRGGSVNSIGMTRTAGR